MTAVGTAVARRTEYAYDRANRLAGVIEAPTIPSLRRASSLAYDGVGNLKTNIQPGRLAIHYRYDHLDRPTSIQEGALSAPYRSTLFTYDDANNKMAVRDPANRWTNYNLDKLGRTTKVTLPDNDIDPNNNPTYIVSVRSADV